MKPTPPCVAIRFRKGICPRHLWQLPVRQLPPPPILSLFFSLQNTLGSNFRKKEQLQLQLQKSSRIISVIISDRMVVRCVIMERKKPIKKNHIKEFGGRMPRRRPRDKLGSRDVPGTLACMCKSILKGQNVPGTDGTYHGTDGTCPRDRRDAHQGVSRQNSLCLLVFSFPSYCPGLL